MSERCLTAEGCVASPGGGRTNNSTGRPRPGPIDYFPRLGSNVVIFQPIGAPARKSILRDLGNASPSHSSGAGAEVIPFRPLRHPPQAKSAVSRWQAAGNYAGADASTTSDDEYRQRMFENLLAAAWVVTLMSAAYCTVSAML
jgi:hypothetical protein